MHRAVAIESWKRSLPWSERELHHREQGRNLRKGRGPPQDEQLPLRGNWQTSAEGGKVKQTCAGVPVPPWNEEGKKRARGAYPRGREQRQRNITSFGVSIGCQPAMQRGGGNDPSPAQTSQTAPGRCRSEAQGCQGCKSLRTVRPLSCRGTQTRNRRGPGRCRLGLGFQAPSCPRRGSCHRDAVPGGSLEGKADRSECQGRNRGVLATAWVADLNSRGSHALHLPKAGHSQRRWGPPASTPRVAKVGWHGSKAKEGGDAV